MGKGQNHQGNGPPSVGETVSAPGDDVHRKGCLEKDAYRIIKSHKGGVLLPAC